MASDVLHNPLAWAITGAVALTLLPVNVPAWVVGALAGYIAGEMYLHKGKVLL